MDFAGPNGDLLARLMSAASLRSRVISGNLANQNTPGYQRKLVRFEELLSAELLEGASPERLARIEPEVVVDPAAEASPDGNSVDLEQEMNAMRENRLLYELYATLLTATEGGAPTTSDLSDDGRDAVVLINGNQATTNGLAARVSTDGFDVTITLDGAGALNTAGGTETFQITGGGAWMAAMSGG